jgi:hypothetical protein
LGDVTGEDATPAPNHPIIIKNIGVSSRTYNAAAVQLLTRCGGMLYTYDEMCKHDTYNSRHEATVAAFDKDKKTATGALEDGKERAVTEIEHKLADGHGEVRRRRERVPCGRDRYDERGWSDVEGVLGGLFNAITHRA